MRKVLKRLPSPSMAVAFVALLAALGGTAVALPGKNGVKKDDIAKGAVNSSDVKNNSLTTSDVKTSTLRGSDVRANTLTGSDVNEGSLGKVPSASQADNAGTAGNANTVGGRSADSLDEPFKFARVLTTGDVDEANTRGLTDADVSLSGATLYCFELGTDIRFVNATVDWVGGGGDAVIHANAGPATCPGTADASVRIVDASDSTAVNRDFYVQFIR